MNKKKIFVTLLATALCAIWVAAQAPAQQGRAGRGGRAGRNGRKVVLAWADTRNGIGQHESTGHALATIERIGYESGLYDTWIRTDSEIVSYHPLMTTGQPASGGPSLANIDAIFFLGHREIPLNDRQKADLLKFVHDDGKGFVAGHTGTTAFMSWPEFNEMLGAQFDQHPYGVTPGTIVNEDPNFPAVKMFPPSFPFTEEYYQPMNFSRDRIHVLLRLDMTGLPPNQGVHIKNGDWPLAWAKMYGKGRVFYSALGHASATWDNPDVYHMYYEAIKWALGEGNPDVTPRPFSGATPADAK